MSCAQEVQAKAAGSKKIGHDTAAGRTSNTTERVKSTVEGRREVNRD